MTTKALDLTKLAQDPQAELTYEQRFDLLRAAHEAAEGRFPEVTTVEDIVGGVLAGTI